MAEIPGDQPDFPVAASANWRRAADFLAEAREKQHRRGKKMGGRQRLPQRTIAAIETSLSDERLVGPAASAVGDAGAAAGRLFGYFAEMCRRNQVILPENLRREVHFILAVELLANMEHLGSPGDKLVAATVQHGVLALHKIPELWTAFEKEPWMFQRAAELYAGDPKAFLTGVAATMETLHADERFASLRNMPYVFKRAAVSYSDPENFLAGVVKTLDRLQKDERFASLRDTPFAFSCAAIVHTSDPDGFLGEVIDTIKDLERDERFASVRFSPHVYTVAAVQHHADPEKFLVDLVASVETMKRDERFASFLGRPYMFIDAALRGGSEPDQYLLGMIRDKDERGR